MSDDQKMHNVFAPSETMIPLLDGRKTCVSLPAHFAEGMSIGDAITITEVSLADREGDKFAKTGYQYTGLITWIDQSPVQVTLSLKNVGYVVPADLMGYSPTREGAN